MCKLENDIDDCAKNYTKACIDNVLVDIGDGVGTWLESDLEECIEVCKNIIIERIRWSDMEDSRGWYGPILREWYRGLYRKLCAELYRGDIRDCVGNPLWIILGTISWIS